MWEVELKAWADPELEIRLEALGATLLRREVIEDIYFQHPCRSFAETDEELRVRTVDKGKGFITYKGPSTDATRQAKEELETPIPDPPAVKALLRRLGFVDAIYKCKRCSHWRLDDAILTVGDVEGLGLFVEVEIPTEREDDVAANRARLPDFLDRMDIPRDRVEIRYFTEMLTEKGLGRPPNP
ncbi:MAG: class IV adenylate cyclase [Methanopyri archaeon]|nr:class IV adenylate cyclase [Methanopyri archaeon]